MLAPQELPQVAPQLKSRVRLSKASELRLRERGQRLLGRGLRPRDHGVGGRVVVKDGRELHIVARSGAALAHPNLLVDGDGVARADRVDEHHLRQLSAAHEERLRVVAQQRVLPAAVAAAGAVGHIVKVDRIVDQRDEQLELRPIPVEAAHAQHFGRARKGKYMLPLT
ncbi:mechanosensitive ion channel [Babesia caballi]|uniref:Mechanosensitive ion channel n=1 Tax=Babesia caballi TaxID=5871 RepID=A0AAV4LUR2_BABCB|nr:mechanosensitive ion channel [Babesia caballi]